jgi:hypothetical protein
MSRDPEDGDVTTADQLREVVRERYAAAATMAAALATGLGRRGHQ